MDDKKKQVLLALFASVMKRQATPEEVEQLGAAMSSSEVPVKEAPSRFTKME